MEPTKQIQIQDHEKKILKSIREKIHIIHFF